MISESINEQILFSRSATNDILLYMSQIFKPRFKGTMANINEKYIVDKLYDINLRMEKISNFKKDLENNIENNENSFISFHEEINSLLSNMKVSFFIHKNSSYDSSTIFVNNENNSKINYINIPTNSYSRSLNQGIDINIYKNSNRKK